MKLSHYIFAQNVKQLKTLKQNFERSGIKFGNLVESAEKTVNYDKEERKYFLWVGRIEPFKSIELLIEIAKLMKKEKFIVIGVVNSSTKYTENAVQILKDRRKHRVS